MPGMVTEQMLAKAFTDIFEKLDGYDITQRPVACRGRGSGREAEVEGGKGEGQEIWSDEEALPALAVRCCAQTD